MSFLNLSPWLAGLLLALTAAAIVALYLMKPTPRRMVVSSTLLWSRVLRERHRSSDRRRWWISLLLALSIGLAVALAIASPEWGRGSDQPRRVVIVLDNSPTLASRTWDGRTRWDQAVEEARALLEKGRGSSEYLVVDTAGQIASAAFEERSTAMHRLETLQLCLGCPYTFPELPYGDAEIHFVSDGVWIDRIDVPKDAQLDSVFQPAENVGITRFAIQPLPADPQSFEAFIEVTSAARAPMQVNLHVSVGGQPGLRKTIHLEPGEVRGEVLDLASLEGGPVRASITAPGDSLDVDNFAYGYLPTRRKSRVVLVSGGNPYLESFLRTDPRVELIEVSPENIEDRPAANITIFDRCAPEDRPQRPYWLIAPPATSWLPRSGGETAGLKVRQWDGNHVLMQSVSVEDLAVGAVGRYDSRDMELVVGSANNPLVLSGETPVRWLLMSFALDESNFPFHAGFPIFLSNAVSWLATEPTALSRSPGTVFVPGSGARITTWDGKPIRSYSLGGQTGFEAGSPGLYVAVRGQERFYVAVSALDPDISGINRTRFPERAIPSRTGSAGGWSPEVWRFLLLLAFTLLLVEWGTYHRRWTV